MDIYLCNIKPIPETNDKITYPNHINSFIWNWAKYPNIEMTVLEKKKENKLGVNLRYSTSCAINKYIDVDLNGVSIVDVLNCFKLTKDNSESKL